MNNDTIAAISTPLGEGAIGIIKISGKDARNILSKVFRPKRPLDVFNLASHTIHYGHIFDGKNVNIPIDEVLVTIMQAPRTYTKEDIVEISCHGSPVLLQKIMDKVITAGARPAEPGEFTKRAFLNGRIDLSQAEAVIDIINAKSEEASLLAITHLNGYLSSYIINLQDSIKEILTIIEAEIDFPEEDIPVLNHDETQEGLSKLKNSIKKLINSYNQGKVLKNGVSVAIIGKTNVGKSSLFNLLVKNPSRALVTHIPGTTRDIIEESVNIKGRLFKFIDTAGLKSPRGIIEEKSLDLTNKCIEEAQCIIFLLDGSKQLNRKELGIWKLAKKMPNIVVINKVDLPQKFSLEKIQKIFNTDRVLNISCKENSGIEELKSNLLEISNKIYSLDSNSDLILTNIRHKNILEKTLTHIENAISATSNSLPIEFIAADLKYGLENLQELTGEKVTETILEGIFSNFCIGK